MYGKKDSLPVQFEEIHSFSHLRLYFINHQGSRKIIWCFLMSFNSLLCLCQASYSMIIIMYTYKLTGIFSLKVKVYKPYFVDTPLHACIIRRTMGALNRALDNRKKFDDNSG